MLAVEQKVFKIAPRIPDKEVVGTFITLPPISASGSDSKLRAIMSLLDGKLASEKNLTPGERRLASLTAYQWKIKFAWVLKEYTREIYSPVYGSTNYKILEDEGLSLHALLELCYRLFDFLARVDQSHLVADYADFGVLFEKMVLERVNHDLNVFHKDKESYLRAAKSFVVALKQKTNPYPDSIEWQHSHNFFNLILAIIPVIPTDDNHLKKSRKAVRTAYESYSASVATFFSSVSRDNRKYFCAALPTEDGGIKISQKRSKNKPAYRKISKDFLDGSKSFTLDPNDSTLKRLASAKL